jgi:dTDP-glucose 4,6-dehydratase
LVREIIEITGTKSKMVYKLLPQDDPQRRQPDITKAKKILKWQPEVSRTKGLQKTFDYFKNLITAL